MGKQIGIKTQFSDGVFVLPVEDETISTRDRVLVESDTGSEVADVVIGQVEGSQLPFPGRVKRILRRLGSQDEQWLATLQDREREAMRYARRKARALGLEMKVSKVSMDFDGERGTFYFTAPQRVDFRELVRILARKFHIRVEMRQIGVRDEAALVSGLGPCGKTLCCGGHMEGFPPINVKMARDQGVEPNSSSATGMCGRLKCCLRFEYEGYTEESGKAGGCGGCSAKKAKKGGADDQPDGRIVLRGPESSPGSTLTME
ncbi:MAG TPA: regulatory iron-sulfur-containing complex subunit RicT [Gammaproteobacteria bacterium]|nr:regulatory iron-sulfur-containing complex subunit RicT [Gammaproteobacteria bacterium]